jgi:hypothetical protein
VAPFAEDTSHELLHCAGVICETGTMLRRGWDRRKLALDLTYENSSHGVDAHNMLPWCALAGGLAG